MSVEAAGTAPVPTGESGRTPAPAQRVIRRAAVLGAGTMGSRIAAHLANAGLPVVLLDIPAKEGPRSGPAAQALEALKKSKPAAFYDPAFASRIIIGNFDDNMPLVADCDWIIEAVAENLAIKQSLLERVLPHLRPEAILTTNTSGLPIASIAAHLPQEVRRRFFGAHFFNPPRYMRLVEIIPTPEADPAAIAAIAHFADVLLGKEVVFARDTPNFIANRIGVFIMLEAVRLMQEEDLTIEEVDALTGTAIGWPRSGTFRLADMVGIDVLAHVAGNFEGTGVIPPFVKAMLERGWLGDKTKRGFYRKEKDAQGNEVRFALDWKTLEYAPAARPKLPALEMAKNTDKLTERLAVLLSGDVRKDKAARFHWRLLRSLWNYAADCLPEIADDTSSVDRAMRAGFNWEMGPFELWDAAGVPATVARMRADKDYVSPVVERLLAEGHITWPRPATTREGHALVATFRAANGVVKHNPGASLVDLGDGVACIELHSKKNAVGEDIVRFITDVCGPFSDAVRNFEALVISGDAEHFSVGANLVQLLLAAQEGEWDEIDFAVRAFQRMTASIKFCPRPVVVAPYSFCLGGGAEIALHAARRQAHAELYMGLVETGVGLLPGGGGCKEMLLRTSDPAALRHTLETIAMAKVSTSAVEARQLGLLSAADGITMNRERLLLDAKQVARDLATRGYSAPLPRTDIPAPGESVLATLELGIHTMRQGEYITDHDVKVAKRVARVLSGGPITPGTPVSEQFLLDLEREAFLSLCGEKKTQERMAFTLKTGRPLRN